MLASRALRLKVLAKDVLGSDLAGDEPGVEWASIVAAHAVVGMSSW